ncbi:multidrug/biocide efflux PACE transporter [Devosia sp. ZB163]|uniref:multidrug/biocide efflux PACE transporter n=1 Tax=Devosia sp. ZB163 TaxID=3025938 RepID=UPI002361A193|nr:multidrug/biocide efflux PACE transporter [Devosia sp. ZB163]MDC9825449.1 multidrug/biocide efflux PACE transporter [Devosia sp. ZB163]
MQLKNRSFIERIGHAVGFEVIALIVCAPIAAWLLDRPITHVGLLALMLSTTAMTWNVIYNVIFDRLWPLASVPRTLKVRALHALGFEAGLVLVGVPLAAWMLDISLLQAFVLDIGFFLFFLPYAFVYNWVYDGLRQLWVERKPAAELR